MNYCWYCEEKKEITPIENPNSVFMMNVKNILSENKYSFLCIDGRNSLWNMAHFPWGNMWHFASLLSWVENAGISVNRAKLFNDYIEFIGWIEKFIFHTDEHPGDIEIDWKIVWKTGCGHMRLLLSTDLYNVSPESKKFIFEKMSGLPVSQVEILKWWHWEQWAFIVSTSLDYTIPNLIEEVQYFVYDQGYFYDINQEFLEEILNSTDENLIDYINETCDKHFGITGGKLAVWLPIYTI